MLIEEEKRELIRIARQAIVLTLTGDRRPVKTTASGALLRPGGAFVTIRKQGELRGCIGYIESPLPLAEVVAEVAVKAALDDPRFAPVSCREFEECTVEVSVLSPLRQIAAIEGIRVGEHGLLIEHGYARGLLLPQVAREYGWDRETFLAYTARKAGLPWDAWKDPGTQIFVFSAEVIEEEKSVAEGGS